MLHHRSRSAGYSVHRVVEWPLLDINWWFSYIIKVLSFMSKRFIRNKSKTLSNISSSWRLATRNASARIISTIDNKILPHFYGSDSMVLYLSSISWPPPSSITSSRDARVIQTTDNNINFILMATCEDVASVIPWLLCNSGKQRNSQSKYYISETFVGIFIFARNARGITGRG